MFNLLDIEYLFDFTQFYRSFLMICCWQLLWNLIIWFNFYLIKRWNIYHRFSQFSIIHLKIWLLSWFLEWIHFSKNAFKSLNFVWLLNKLLNIIITTCQVIFKLIIFSKFKDLFIVVFKAVVEASIWCGIVFVAEWVPWVGLRWSINRR